MKSPVIAVILVLLLVPAAGAAEPTVESFVLDDTTYGLQRPLWLYKSAGRTGSAKHPHNLFVFLQKEYIDELAVPAMLQKLVASGEIPPTIAVVLDTSTERPTDIANRAKFDRFVETRRTPNGVIFVEANRHLRDVLTMKGYVFRYSEVPRNIHDPEHLRPTLPAGIVDLSNAVR